MPIPSQRILSGVALLVGTLTIFPATAATAAEDGKALFEAHCSMCHPMLPPPTAAPPVLGIAIHYREAFGTDREAAINHMVQFMQQPDSATSKLEPKAIKRFGLMPKQSLSVTDLRNVSAWLWEQHDPKFTLPGNCR